jgi:hypothetical protein
MIPQLLVLTVLAAAPEATADPSREAVAKALAFLDGDGAKLEKGSSCINCHHVPLRFWALREAKQAGLPVDGGALQETLTSQVKRVVELQDNYRDKQWGHSLAMLFVLGAADREQLSLSEEEASKLLKILIAEQADDGTWKAAQQFGNQRRPQKDANQAQTMWSMLALARLEPRPGAQAAREKGMKWLESAEPGTTIDARALRVVIERRFGAAEKAGQLLADLIKSQREDGGWGWQPDDASDAWATGLALYALSQSGDAAPAGAIERARGFLSKTQRENGSWLVEGKLTKNADMASYFGTAWAIIGISRTLPKP